MARNDQLFTFTLGQQPTKEQVDSYRNLPIFDANANHTYWLDTQGYLKRDDIIGPKTIGSVLQRQTLFWVGPAFGFGFYRAGNYSQAFVFDAENAGLKDGVQLPHLRGQLVDSTCVFTEHYCWFFIAMQESGKTINRCVLIRRDGSVKATAEAEAQDGSWLSTLRGKCAAGTFLLVATDDGIIKVEPSGDQIVESNKYPDAEPFIDTSAHLFPGDGGIYVVNRREIILLKIK